MNIDKNIPIGSSKSSNKSSISLEILNNLKQIGDSCLIDCENPLQSSYWRSAFDYNIKRNDLKIRVKLKKWDSENYRVWRIN